MKAIVPLTKAETKRRQRALGQIELVDPPLVQVWLGKIRDRRTEPRHVLDAMGSVASALLIQASHRFPMVGANVTTRMGTARIVRPGKIIVVNVMRAADEFARTAFRLMEGVSVHHLGLERDERTLEPSQYLAKPPVKPDEVDLCLFMDPMLATGGSGNYGLKVVRDQWAIPPERTLFIGLVGAPQGVLRIRNNHPGVPIYLAALDGGLTRKGFIRKPGVGDVGDIVNGMSD